MTTKAQTDFTSRLCATVAQSRTGQDLFLSPFSIQAALAMCAVGAKGETRKALTDLIAAPENVAEQNRQYRAWLDAINATEDVQLSTANALWVQRGEPLNREFLQAITDFYHGACSDVDFRGLPDQAVTTINAWVESQTAGKIRDLIHRQVITPDTRLILTNAIYFKGKWASEFESSHTWDEDWHGLNGTRPTPMMHQRGDYLYCEEADFQALDLPYLGEQLSLLVVLPTKTDGLSALEARWSSANLYQKVTGSLASQEVIVSLPRFKLETSYQLKPILSEMGADLPFSDRADFSGISATPLKIAEVIHKAFIEVNEEGTEAAAATGVVMAKCSAVMSEPKNFAADHPFLFLIRDRRTNAVLFQGRVLDPRG